jgi:predicted ATPase with chaperone activity
VIRFERVSRLRGTSKRGAFPVLVKKLSGTPICERGEIRQFCNPQEGDQSLIRAAMSQLNLSARAYYRILKLARTNADLVGCE